MFRYGILIVSLLLILSACAGSDTGSDSAAANAGDDGGSVVATTVTQPPTTAAQDQSTSTASTAPGRPTTTEAATPTTTQPVPKGPSEVLLAIQERGVINVGIAAGGSIAFENFENGLAAAVADVLVPGVEVAYVRLTGAERFTMLGIGDIDLGVMLTTATVRREQEQGIAFSQPYLLGGTVALVSADSGMVSIGDLEGKTIAVLDGTSTMLMLEDALAQANVSATLDGMETMALVDFALSEGDVDAAATSWGYAANKILRFELERPDKPLSMIPIDVLREPIAIFTDASDPAFAADVRAALQTVIDDGTWLALFESSFGAPPPWTVEEMLAVPPEDR